MTQAAERARGAGRHPDCVVFGKTITVSHEDNASSLFSISHVNPK